MIAVQNKSPTRIVTQNERTHVVKKAIKRLIVEQMIDDINKDITRLYDELLPLKTDVDIDMVCYMDTTTKDMVWGYREE